MKQEDKLLKKVGKTNPFNVPEGYFEQLTSEVMNKLPEQEKPLFEEKKITTWQRIKPWVYMAAMFAGAALIIRVASDNPNPFDDKNITSVEATDTEIVYDDTYIDYAVSQAMIDDYSLYVYLTDAGTE